MSELLIHCGVDFHANRAQVVGQLTEVAADPAAQLPPEDLVIEADAYGAGLWGFVRVHDLVSII
jgi:hypothetical protein